MYALSAARPPERIQPHGRPCDGFAAGAAATGWPYLSATAENGRRAARRGSGAAARHRRAGARIARVARAVVVNIFASHLLKQLRQKPVKIIISMF